MGNAWEELMGKRRRKKVGRDNFLKDMVLVFENCHIVTGKQIGRASCRERVYVLV